MKSWKFHFDILKWLWWHNIVSIILSRGTLTLKPASTCLCFTRWLFWQTRTGCGWRLLRSRKTEEDMKWKYKSLVIWNSVYFLKCHSIDSQLVFMEAPNSLWAWNHELTQNLSDCTTGCRWTTNITHYIPTHLFFLNKRSKSSQTIQIYIDAFWKGRQGTTLGKMGVKHWKRHIGCDVQT